MATTLQQRAETALAYLTRRIGELPGPQTLLIETTADCNLSCPMCWRTVVDYPTNLLPDELLFPLIDEFAEMGGDTVLLYALGEPMLDPRIFDILAYCRRRDLGTVISTNGTLLTEKRREALLKVGCDHFIVGIDATTPATYNKYRTGGNYDKVVANTRALAAAKVAAGSPMQLVVQFIRMAENLHEEAEFLALWRDVAGIDSVRVKDEDFGLDFRLHDSNAARRHNPCYMLWRGPLIVQASGDVLPCHWMGWHGMNTLGNLREKSLRQCWNSPILQAMRRQQASLEIAADSPCATCPAPRPRLPCVMGAMLTRGVKVRGLIPAAERIERHFPSLFKEPQLPRGQGPQPRPPEGSIGASAQRR